MIGNPVNLVQKHGGNLRVSKSTPRNKPAVTGIQRDNFYKIFARYTTFDNGKLHLNYQYVKTNILNMIDWNGLLHYIRGYHLDDPHFDMVVIHYLEQKTANFKTKYGYGLLLFLIKLYKAEEGASSIQQINNRVMNTRIKYSLPFTNLHETGYLINYSNIRGKSKLPEKGISATFVGIKTNLCKKNLIIIKALLRFSIDRDIFLSQSSIDNEDIDEPLLEVEKWMIAMTRQHGQNMVTYLDECSSTLVSSFLIELCTRGLSNEADEFSSMPNFDMTCSVLKCMTDIVTNLPDNISKQDVFVKVYNDAKDNLYMLNKETRQSTYGKSSNLSSSSDTKSFEWLMEQINMQPKHCPPPSRSHSSAQDNFFFDIVNPFLSEPKPSYYSHIM
ncbi:hypothetical protein LPJ66_003080 [Kickxella alabastrina]|uniref:Uncharacterized protein n=1 Tax=Kickxella alabastrina TaxID=61397 RepID=A0ACC1IMS9_9FUNG|nr:hypothetical protein LPJ66_003080 [Kickxella alabastrina]